LNDGLDKHYEVDEKAYNNYEEGGIIYMYQAMKSGYIFRDNDSIKIKLFDSPYAGE